MNLRTVLLTIAIGLSAFSAAPAVDLSIRPGDQVVRIHVRNAEQLRRLEQMDLDVWSHEIGVGDIDVHVSVHARRALDAAGMTYDVLNDDLTATYIDELASRQFRGAGDFDQYKSYAEIMDFIDNLAARRPDLASVMTIGQSLEGRDIRVLHVTGPDTGDGPPPGQRHGVFYHALQHAREWITGPVVLYLADHLINEYDDDSCLRALVDRTDFYLAPCVNPDGYEYTWTDERLWRKNRRDNMDGTFGVDLNRNWAYGWGGGGSSGSTGNETYRGPSPFSEPETQVLSSFVSSHPTIRAYMDYHSYGQLILWPFGTTCTEPPEPDASSFWSIGTQMQSLIASIHGVNHTAGPVCLTLYQASGASVDWVYGDQGRYAYTIELRDEGQSGFLLPADQILPTCEENLPAILALSDWATAGLQLDLPDGPPTMIDAGGGTTISVRIGESIEGYLPGSGSCHYRTDSQAPFASVPLSVVSGDIYEAAIPAVPCGSTVQFYFTATGDGGYEAALPCDAPTSLFEAAAIEVATVFADQMEISNGGWTVGEVGDDATTGIWNRMDPELTDAQPEDDHTADPGALCWVTDGNAGSGVGSFDVDNGRTTLRSPDLDLSAAQNPHVSYWRWYSNTAGAAPNQDVFVVDISNDGGQSWSNVETLGPDGSGTSGGWFRHEFRVADVTAPTAQVVLRFIASDEGSGSIVEAAIDDLEVLDLACSCATLAGDVDGDGLLNALDIAAFIDAAMNDPFYAACADVAAPFSAPLDEADGAALVDLLLGL